MKHFIDEPWAIECESFWKGATDHKRLRTSTGLKAANSINLLNKRSLFKSLEQICYHFDHEIRVCCKNKKIYIKHNLLKEFSIPAVFTEYFCQYDIRDDVIV